MTSPENFTVVESIAEQEAQLGARFDGLVDSLLVGAPNLDRDLGRRRVGETEVGPTSIILESAINRRGSYDFREVAVTTPVLVGEALGEETVSFKSNRFGLEVSVQGEALLNEYSPQFVDVPLARYTAGGFFGDSIQTEGESKLAAYQQVIKKLEGLDATDLTYMELPSWTKEILEQLAAS